MAEDAVATAAILCPMGRVIAASRELERLLMDAKQVVVAECRWPPRIMRRQPVDRLSDDSSPQKAAGLSLTRRQTPCRASRLTRV